MGKHILTAEEQFRDTKFNVSQDVIDFLEMHDVYWDINQNKYYKVNNILYKYNYED